MKVGTKSVLFGVHQFLWHPLTVALAYRKLYGKWPTWVQWVCIFCHDLGYWDCPEMDGPVGRYHPIRGAQIAQRVTKAIARFRGRSELRSEMLGITAYLWSVGHSRELAKQRKCKPSELCWADKYCCFYDPTWFYLLRGHLSGEIYEFRANAKGHIPDDYTFRQWYRWYRNKVKNLPEIQKLLW